MAAVAEYMRPPMRILLIRHGESFNNALMAEPGMTRENWERGREPDPNLSALGRKQAEALGRFLAGEAGSNPRLSEVLPLGMLCVSPVKRAMQTLEPTARRLAARPKVWTDCFEVGGIYHASGTGSRGLTRSQMLSDFPIFDLPDDVTEDGWYTLDGKESLDQARQRAQGTADRIRELARSKDRGFEGTLVLLSHHDHLNLLLQALLGETKSFFHANTAMSCLTVFVSGHVEVRFLNCTDHLLGIGRIRTASL
uniref:Phosphoglycerate mutase (2,3-diphosphoglycerate-dependent) n=1 Tax=Alexandrium andersonii TaxID=327968 RepID=A0A7S2F0V9_9DINO